MILYRETNLFVSQHADGVLGLSPKEHRFTNFINHLLKNSLINQKIFSLCLGNNGGSFTLGGINNTLHSRDNQIEYINYKSDDLYKIYLLNIFVGSVEFQINTNVYAGLDTGTTNSYFPRLIFESFFIKLKELCSSPNYCLGDILKVNEEICFYLKNGVSQEIFYKSMPIFIFNFQNINYEWMPSSYLFNKVENNEYCLNIQNWE